MVIKKPKEGDLVRQCLDYLDKIGVFAWRNNSGAVAASYTRKGDGVTKSRFIRYGYPGSGDIIGILSDGTFLSVECKKPGGKTSKDRALKQEAFATRIRASGGTAIMVTSLADLMECPLR